MKPMFWFDVLDWRLCAGGLGLGFALWETSHPSSIGIRTSGFMRKTRDRMYNHKIYKSKCTGTERGIFYFGTPKP